MKNAAGPAKIGCENKLAQKDASDRIGDFLDYGPPMKVTGRSRAELGG